MRAIVCERFGPPESLRLIDVEKPVPGKNDVLLRVAASSINKADWIYLRGKPFFARLMGIGLLGPKAKILGADVSGQVEAVGEETKLFKPGDKVFGLLPSDRRGAYAEYACAEEEVFARMPSGVSFDQAAAVPMAALTALDALQSKGRIAAGQRVLIHGASGGVGTYAVQVAKSFGAEVTAVVSSRNTRIAESIGADHVVDYSKQDFTLNGEKYDLIIGANGNRSIFDYCRSLTPNGTYVMSGGKGRQIAQAVLLGRLLSKKNGKKVRVCSWKFERENLLFLAKLLDSGRIVPVVDASFPLEEVPKAYRYFEDGEAKGKIVISMAV